MTCKRLPSLPFFFITALWLLAAPWAQAAVASALVPFNPKILQHPVAQDAAKEAMGPPAPAPLAFVGPIQANALSADRAAAAAPALLVAQAAATPSPETPTPSPDEATPENKPSITQRIAAIGNDIKDQTLQTVELAQKTVANWQQEGVASWYGPGFHGRKTASGERFNTNELTAAHLSLPFGTKLLVRNESNGKEVVVRVNDRGPYIKSRIIDLSNAAARALGIQGIGRVIIQRLEADDDAPSNVRRAD